MKENRRLKRQQLAINVIKLIEALADGKYLEFKHNNGEWRMWDGFSLNEVTNYPNRFRIAKQHDLTPT